MGDITSELLKDILQLTHPDRHPAQRELAQRVTAELVALKPFVFPAPRPEPPPIYEESSRDASVKEFLGKLSKASTPYPCELCAYEIPRNYCTACRAEWEKRQQQEDEREEKKRLERNARQRELYAWRKQEPSETACQSCGAKFLAKRQDAKYCSASCRQHAYLRRAGKPSNAKPLPRQEIERAIDSAFAAEPDRAFSVRDLCERVYPELECGRKQRVAIAAAAKRIITRRPPGEIGWDWWRGDGQGRPLLFWNCASVISYAMARLKCDQWQVNAPEEELKAMLAPGHHRDYHALISEGGAWWRHWQLRLAEAKGETETEHYRKLRQEQDPPRSSSARPRKPLVVA